MKPIRLEDLIRATGGRLLGDYRDMNTVITGAQSDNRLIEEGNVFFAFPGERVDGHRFVTAALKAGASGAVVTKTPQEGGYEILPGCFCLLVDDAVLAYGDFARWYRAQFSIPVIGITGSVGKTTTKDMVASVLAQHYRTAHTAGNFNNNIGLPRTVLTIGEDTEAAVIEMGMNHPGEISYLTGIARPTVAVITNIGEAHIGNLGNKENIFKAKCEIFEGLEKGAPRHAQEEAVREDRAADMTGVGKEPAGSVVCHGRRAAGGGFAVLNGDDEYLIRLREDPEIPHRYRLTYVGESADCEWRAVDIEDTLSESIRFTAATPVGTFPVTVPALGRHMIYPALTAAAVGAALGLSAEEIQGGIAAYVPTKMRMETIRLENGVTIYNDTYNANPQSMKAGLLTLSKSSGRRIAVLGDMFELGEMEETLHREVGAYAASLPIDVLVMVGKASSYMAEAASESRDRKSCPSQEGTAVTADGRAAADMAVRSAAASTDTGLDGSRSLKQIFRCADKEEATSVIDRLRGPETTWLFKASRGMALEELVNHLREQR